MEWRDLPILLIVFTAGAAIGVIWSASALEHLSARGRERLRYSWALLVRLVKKRTRSIRSSPPAEAVIGGVLLVLTSVLALWFWDPTAAIGPEFVGAFWDVLLFGVLLAWYRGHSTAIKETEDDYRRLIGLLEDTSEPGIITKVDLFRDLEFSVLPSGRSALRLPGLKLVDAQLTNFSPAWTLQLVGSCCRSVRFVGSLLSNAHFVRCVLEDCDLSTCDLTGAEFSGSSLTRCRFSGSDLRGADFSEVTCLMDVEFNVEGLSGATFAFADLAGADFTGAADVGKASFVNAQNAELARWPDGFTPTTSGNLETADDNTR